MINHITFGLSNIARSCDFYDAAFGPLGVRRLVQFREAVEVAGYGDDLPWFWIAEQDATRGKLHIAIRAESRALVDAFHAAALAAGGRDYCPPGLRSHYHTTYFGAFVLDPDGHNIEAVCHRPE